MKSNPEKVPSAFSAPLGEVGHEVDSVLTPVIPLSPEDFRAIRTLVYNQFGVNLTEEKHSLVVGRLQKVLKTRHCTSFKDYLHLIETDQTGHMLIELVNRLTTNHTLFFREKEHFEFLTRSVLPEITETLKMNRCRDLRVWCAGCSSGEETYTLVMTMMEWFGHDYGNWDAGLLATDISENVLSIARMGVYPDDRMQSIPANLRTKYFRKTPDGFWEATELVKKQITFRRLNLISPTFPFRKPFDIIFCRNVMIYFDQVTRDALVRRYFDCTKPGGYLFVGHSESLRRESCPYEFVKPAIYRKRRV